MVAGVVSAVFSLSENGAAVSHGATTTCSPPPSTISTLFTPQRLAEAALVPHRVSTSFSSISVPITDTAPTTFSFGIASRATTGITNQLHDDLSHPDRRQHPPNRRPATSFIDPIPKETPGQFYKFVTLYPQSHHPILSRVPVVLQSRDEFMTDSHTASLRDTAGQMSNVNLNEAKAVQEKPGKLGAAMKEVWDERIRLREPFGNPKDVLNTQVLFPIPQDW